MAVTVQAVAEVKHLTAPALAPEVEHGVDEILGSRLDAAIVLSEVLGPPRAFRPYRRRR